MFWKPQVKPLPGSYWNRFSRLSTSWILSIQRFLQIFTQQLLLWQFYSMENLGSVREKRYYNEFFWVHISMKSCGSMCETSLGFQCIVGFLFVAKYLRNFFGMNSLILNKSFKCIVECWDVLSITWVVVREANKKCLKYRDIRELPSSSPGGWRVRFLFQSMTIFVFISCV